MPIARLGTAEIYYETAGSGQPVLFISGLGGLASYWKPQAPIFSAEFQVITYDQRGVGSSIQHRPDCSLEILARDVIDLLDALGIDRAHICGHSAGGMIAQVLATTYPDRLLSLVLCSTRARADSFTRRIMNFRRELLSGGNIELYVKSSSLFTCPSWWIAEHDQDLLQSEAATIQKFVDPAIMENRIDALLLHDKFEEVQELDIPTLVVCAEDDFLTPVYYSRELHRLIPNSRLVCLDRGGHACTMTNPQAFNVPVLWFMRSSKYPTWSNDRVPTLTVEEYEQ